MNSQMTIHDINAPQTPAGRLWAGMARSVALVLLALIAILSMLAVVARASDQRELSSNVITLAVPAFLAGALSFLSPCSLPIVIGYFSVSLQQGRERIGRMTLGFLLGLGTTMAVLGAGFTALGGVVIDFQQTMTLCGGVLIAGFGVMSLTGRGFSGVRSFARPAATTGGAYLYGLIFALGWTTCVGPILGSILTLLLVQGSSLGGFLSLAAGAILALIYVLGLGLPLMMLVSALLHGGPSGRFTRAMRGRAWEIRLGSHTFYVHSTSIISGLLLIGLGILLATGQMTIISEHLASSPFSEIGVRLETALDRVVG
jgi:cytochrome c-type biogenesis protein